MCPGRYGGRQHDEHAHEVDHGEEHSLRGSVFVEEDEQDDRQCLENESNTLAPRTANTD